MVLWVSYPNIMPSHIIMLYLMLNPQDTIEDTIIEKLFEGSIEWENKCENEKKKTVPPKVCPIQSPHEEISQKETKNAGKNEKVKD